jgi:hypothetical protein
MDMGNAPVSIHFLNSIFLHYQELDQYFMLGCLSVLV